MVCGFTHTLILATFMHAAPKIAGIHKSCRGPTTPGLMKGDLWRPYLWPPIILVKAKCAARNIIVRRVGRRGGQPELNKIKDFIPLKRDV